jgi:hypothetical protein
MTMMMEMMLVSLRVSSTPLTNTTVCLVACEYCRLW